MNKVWSLSKSKILMHLQCRRWLWLEMHKAAEKDESADTQTRFTVGNQVGDLARKAHLNGVLVEQPTDFAEATVFTRQTMSRRVPLFEAAFEHRRVRVRADLLLPLARSWHTAEVKSAGEVKDQHLKDVAVQTAVLKEAGVRVSRATVRHIDKTFVYGGDEDYRGLLVDGESHAAVKALVPEVPGWVAAARRTLNGAEPQIEMGAHCHTPWSCPFQSYCGRQTGRGSAYPVELLPHRNGKKLAGELRSEGYADLRRVPQARMPSDLFRRIHLATRKNEPYVDRAGARRDVAAWTFPRAYLDFETIDFAVPIWTGTRPFQAIPFQYSCHIEQADGTVVHREFLELTGENPARACAERLIRDTRGCKTIVAYHARTERGVIESLAAAFPDLRRSLLALASRVVDLLPVVRAHYYHRDMQGSFSMKVVLPTISTKLNYADLHEVSDGRAAQRAYREAVDRGTSDARKQQLKDYLARYCSVDSDGMRSIARHLTRR